MRTTQEHETSTAVIHLMKGVVYREQHEQVWQSLTRHLGPVRDHFDVAGLEVVVDDVEGYAYLRAQETDDEQPLPRLVNRVALSFPVSLLLVLLRKRMVEFEAAGGDSRLVLTRDQIQDLVSVFLPTTTNEARALDRLDTTIKKATELGFLRPLRGGDSYRGAVASAASRRRGRGVPCWGSMDVTTSRSGSPRPCEPVGGTESTRSRVGRTW
jgi:hypothetical protein